MTRKLVSHYRNDGTGVPLSNHTKKKSGIIKSTKEFWRASAVALSMIIGTTGCENSPPSNLKPSTTNSVSENNIKQKIPKLISDDSIFKLIEQQAQHFPNYPFKTTKKPHLRIYENKQNSAKAFVIEDIHNSKFTHEILANVLKEIKDADPSKTLFILEGIKPNEIKNFNDRNSRYPNEICCHISNLSGAKVINPVANVAQWQLVSKFVEEAKSKGYKEEDALGYIVTSLVMGSRPELEIDTINAIDSLHKAWKSKISIQEMYEATDLALDLKPEEIEELIKKIQDDDIETWETIQNLIKAEPEKKSSIIGGLICYYSALKFGVGEYQDPLKAFRKIQNLWGNESPSIENLHNYLIIGMNNSAQKNTNIGKILFSSQDSITQDQLTPALDPTQTNFKNIISIAGYNHSGGIIPVLEKIGFREIKK